MSVFDFLKSSLSKAESPQSPKGLCPNCWGRQEYGGQFFEAVKAEGIDTNNVNEKKGWVQAYVEKNLTGIQLKEDDAQLVCNRCKVRYELNK